MTIIGNSHYETYIAEKIGIPKLRASSFGVANDYIKVTRLWYARVKYEDKNFIISVVESTKWLKTFIGIVDKDMIINSIDQELEYDYVESYLRNFDIYSDDKLRIVDGIPYYYLLTIYTEKSSGTFLVNEPAKKSKQGRFFDALIRMAQTVVANSDDKEIKDYFSQMPVLPDIDVF